MKKRNAPVDIDSKATAEEIGVNDLATQYLLAIDEWTRSGIVGERLGTDEDLVPGAAELADCLKLMERVRQFHPECLADMQMEDGSQSPWLDAAGSPPGRFGRFEIRSQLGSGGFGLVFLALDPNLDREVALKVPRIATLVTEVTQQRFLREAKAAAALDHPNIGAIHESGQVGPVCYIASAYYEGGSLAEYLQRQSPLDPPQAARLVAALADAVHYAHSRGILHRDLKPGNVLLDAPVDSALVEPTSLRISDFGLARIVDDESSATQTGALVGTPAYMSPEQADGRSNQISTASDIYALGAILYEMLTGRPPFYDGSSPEILEAVRSTEPTPPSRLRKEIPRDLEAICLKCLQKSPQQRYAIANALAEDLNHWLAGKSVSARLISRPERALRWCRRNPALSAVSAIAMVALLAGSVASTALWLRADREAARARSRSQQLAEAVDNLNSAIDMLFVTVAQSDELRSYDAEPLRQKLLDQAQQYYQLVASYRPLDEEVSVDYAQTLFRLGLVHKQLGDTVQAEAILAEAIGALSEMPSSPDKTEREVEWNRRRAQVLDQLGCYDEARQLQKDAIQLAEQAVDEPAENRKRFRIAQALLWSDLAGGELIQSNVKAAGEAAGKALRLWRELIDTTSAGHAERVVLGYANSLRTLGISEEESGRLIEAEGHLQEAVRFLKNHACTRENADLMMLLGRTQKKLGISIAKQNRLADAREVYLDAMDWFDKLVQRHPRVPEYRMELCSCRYSLSVTEYLDGNQDRTLTLLKANIAEYAALADAYPDRQIDYWNRAGVAWNMLYQVYLDQEDVESAADAIENSLEFYTRVEAERPDWTFNQVVMAESEINLSRLFVQSGDYRDAVPLIESATARVQAVVDEQPKHDRARHALHDAHCLWADLYLRQDDIDAAIRENDAALGVVQGARAWKAIVRQANLQGQKGDYDGAAKVLNSFLKQTANHPKHYLAVARCAAKIKTLVVQQQPIQEKFHAIGVEAIGRAEPDSEPEQTAFRKSLEDDPWLKIYIAR